MSEDYSLADKITFSQDTKLPYRIHSSSAHSGNFKPSNVLIDRPHDQLSRWSVTPEPPQHQQHGLAGKESGAAFIMLELEQWAVVCSIDVGKFAEPHPCNPQSLRIFAGSSPDHLREIAQSGLRNDGKTERVTVRWAHRAWTGKMTVRKGWKAMRDTHDKQLDHLPCPVKYVKIVPGPAYEPRFNSSIWHIALNGVTDAAIVTKARRKWEEAEALHADRLALKHLRLRGMQTAYRSVMEVLRKYPRTPAHPLEHPLVERLHDALVDRGEFDEVERLLDEMLQAGLMNDRIEAEPATYAWSNIAAATDSGDVPSSRGGHALCAASETECGNSFYLFGGYDGTDALNDLWHAEITDETVRWTPILRADPDALWPGPRLDHQLIAVQGKLWMIGGDEPVSVQPPPPSAVHAASDSYGLVAPDMMDVVEHAKTATRDDIKANVLWSFDLAHREWHRHGVPSVGYGEIEMDQHSMAAAVDDRGQALYILGRSAGRSSGHGSQAAEHSWKLLRYRPAYGAWDEVSHKGALDLRKPRILGIRDDCLIILNETDGEVTVCRFDGMHFVNFERSSSDQRPLTSHPTLLRSYIDNTHSEIVSVFGHEGMCILPKQGKVGRVARYSPSQNRWQALAPDSRTTIRPDAQTSTKADKVTSRCGHEVLYTAAGNCFVVGGQTGGSALSIDCRQLQIYRTGAGHVRRQATLAIRTQRFLEMAETDPAVEALAYLQHDLHAEVDHDDAQESKDFHALLKHLLGRGSQPLESPAPSTLRGRRTAFDKIMQFVSVRYKEPEVDLGNLATIS